MGKIRTTAMSYYRGVPPTIPNMGTLVQGNYTVVAPMYQVIRDNKFFKRNFNNIIYNSYQI
jgi:hypothetical protein